MLRRPRKKDAKARLRNWYLEPGRNLTQNSAGICAVRPEGRGHNSEPSVPARLPIASLFFGREGWRARLAHTLVLSSKCNPWRLGPAVRTWSNRLTPLFPYPRAAMDADAAAAHTQAQLLHSQSFCPENVQHNAKQLY